MPAPCPPHDPRLSGPVLATAQPRDGSACRFLHPPFLACLSPTGPRQTISREREKEPPRPELLPPMRTRFLTMLSATLSARSYRHRQQVRSLEGHSIIRWSMLPLCANWHQNAER